MMLLIRGVSHNALYKCTILDVLYYGSSSNTEAVNEYMIKVWACCVDGWL